jgi:Kef-type K+ transport system membrane component KefB
MEITVLKEHQVLLLLVELFLLLFFARGLGEISRRLGQPAVVGEILGGVLLGPTLFGEIFPDLFRDLFPITDTVQMHMLETFSWLGALFLLMVAGMEVDLGVVRKQGRATIIIAVTRVLVSFGLGFSLGMVLPGSCLPMGIHRVLFASFFGIACAVCAVPVLAKILYELGMLKSDIGLLTLSASTMSDFICWIIFTMIIGVASGAGLQLDKAVGTIISTVVFVGLALTLGRSCIWWIVRRIQGEPGLQSGSVMVFTFLLALGLAIICQLIHIHALFGFFLAGILIGDCPHVTSQTRENISSFVLSLFSPLFFASIGLKVNYFTNFNLWLVLGVFGVIAAGKMIGVLLGGRLSGMTFQDSLPVAAGMLAGGAMEIIISLIGLQYNLIRPEMFVALVIVAVVTSILAGPLMVWSVNLKKGFDLASILPREAVLPDLHVDTIREAIIHLVNQLSPRLRPYKAEEVIDAVLTRESLRGTALGNQLAVPHARLEKLSSPLLAAARIKSGLPLDSPDGEDVHLIFLILTPEADMGMQVQILAGIVGSLQDGHLRHELLDAPDARMQEMLLGALRTQKLNHQQAGAVT